VVYFFIPPQFWLVELSYKTGAGCSKSIVALLLTFWHMQVIKASGEKQTFNRKKFCRSLEKVGASPELVKDACTYVERELKPGMGTSEIFQYTLRYLRKKDPAVATRYNLRRGIMELGPAGFLFEQYIEAILNSYGYHTRRNKIMKGRCVSHEIDIIAHKGNKHFLIEVKYRNNPKFKTDVTIAMYADARLKDIIPRQRQKESQGKRHHMWLMTNAKFTTTAIKYGKCQNIKMTGWNYPKGEGLEDLVSKNMLYPVTSLPSVNSFAREQFARRGIMLAHDLLRYSISDLVGRFDIREKRAQRIVREAHLLIGEG